MLHLENAGLRVSLLDPEADRARLGSRYCVGGYIWQVEDAAKGPLFSGPVFPRPDPSGWDGQGAPEVFEIALGQESAGVGDEVWVIGVGRVRRESPVKPFHVRNNFGVAEFAPWTVETGPGRATFVSDQAFRTWALRLERSVRLVERTLISATTVLNNGSAELPIRWFAHPFFPHAGLEAFGFSRETAFPAWVADAGGFRYNDRGWIERKGDYDWRKGCYQLVQAPFGFPLDARVNHPALGGIEVSCKLPLCFLPIWANEKTVSFEPYLQTQVPPGAAFSWSVEYRL